LRERERGREGGREGRYVLGGHHELVIEHPLGTLVEERGGGMDIDKIVVHDRLEALLRILLRHVGKIPGAYGLLNLLEVPACRGREGGREEGREGGRVGG